jgi:hypothetical protein
MTRPVIGSCGGANEPACPPVNAIMKALANLMHAIESGEGLLEALATAHALIDPFLKRE